MLHMPIKMQKLSMSPWNGRTKQTDIQCDCYMSHFKGIYKNKSPHENQYIYKAQFNNSMSHETGKSIALFCRKNLHQWLPIIVTSS